jgi:hypothetical protein
VAVNGDTIAETNETFTVTLSSPVNATLARSQAIGTIIDDDYKITGTQVSGTNVVISFTTILGRSNRLERADFLNTTNIWSGASGATNVPGSGAITTVTNTGGATQTRRFYRIRLLP